MASWRAQVRLKVQFARKSCREQYSFLQSVDKSTVFSKNWYVCPAAARKPRLESGNTLCHSEVLVECHRMVQAFSRYARYCGEVLLVSQEWVSCQIASDPSGVAFIELFPPLVFLPTKSLLSLVSVYMTLTCGPIYPRMPADCRFI